MDKRFLGLRFAFTPDGPEDSMAEATFGTRWNYVHARLVRQHGFGAGITFSVKGYRVVTICTGKTVWL